MKKFIAVAITLSLFGGTIMAQNTNTPKSTKEKVSYSIGVNIGKELKTKTQELDISNAFLLQGIKDAINGSKTAMSEKNMDSTMTSFQQE